MSLNVTSCINRISEVRAAATDYGSAYLLRMRLQRMVIGVHSLIGRSGRPVARDEQTGLLFTRDGAILSQEAELVDVCNRLLLESQALARRSAALDARWQDGWDTLRGDLDRLENLLRQPSVASVLGDRHSQS